MTRLRGSGQRRRRCITFAPATPRSRKQHDERTPRGALSFPVHCVPTEFLAEVHDPKILESYQHALNAFKCRQKLPFSSPTGGARREDLRPRGLRVLHDGGRRGGLAAWLPGERARAGRADRFRACGVVYRRGGAAIGSTCGARREDLRPRGLRVLHDGGRRGGLAAWLPGERARAGRADRFRACGVVYRRGGAALGSTCLYVQSIR